ncbi:DUF6783 domain-containing protein [Prevotella nigrescens]
MQFTLCVVFCPNTFIIISKEELIRAKRFKCH